MGQRGSFWDIMGQLGILWDIMELGTSRTCWNFKEILGRQGHYGTSWNIMELGTSRTCWNFKEILGRQGHYGTSRTLWDIMRGWKTLETVWDILNNFGNFGELIQDNLTYLGQSEKVFETLGHSLFDILTIWDTQDLILWPIIMRHLGWFEMHWKIMGRNKKTSCLVIENVMMHTSWSNTIASSILIFSAHKSLFNKVSLIHYRVSKWSKKVSFAVSIPQ